jgi:hypothetical protein
MSVYWSKWSDATREAGFQPNTSIEGYGSEYFLRKLVDAARHVGAIPNTIQMMMYRRIDPSFPERQTFNKYFTSRADMLSRLAEWVGGANLCGPGRGAGIGFEDNGQLDALKATTRGPSGSKNPQRTPYSPANGEPPGF